MSPLPKTFVQIVLGIPAPRLPAWNRSLDLSLNFSIFSSISVIGEPSSVFHPLKLTRVVEAPCFA